MIPHLDYHSTRPYARAEHSYIRDRSRIDLNKYWDVRYWSSKFEVRPEDLRKAVEAVGTSPYAVARYLSRGS
jgi:hypothetical protein